MFAPPVQVIRHNPQELAMFAQGMQQFAQGLVSIQEAKEKRAGDSILARISQAETPQEIKSQLNEITRAREKSNESRTLLGNIVNAINPFGEFTGATGAESKISQILIQEKIRQSNPLYQAKIEESKARAKYWEEGGRRSTKKNAIPEIKKRISTLEAAYPNLEGEENREKVTNEIVKLRESLAEEQVKAALQGDEQAIKGELATKKSDKIETALQQIKKGVSPEEIKMEGLSESEIQILVEYYIDLHGSESQRKSLGLPPKPSHIKKFLGLKQ